MTAEHTVLAQLADLDPTRHEPLAGPEQADATLSWVLAHDRAQPAEVAPPRRRRVALVSAAAALVLGLAGASTLPGILSGNGTTAPAAATVPMLTYSEPAGTTGNAELAELADKIRSAGLDQPPPATGPYRYLRHESERWSFTLMADGTMRQDAISSQLERWVAADGSGRQLQTDNGVARYGYYDFQPGEPEPPLDLTGSAQEIVRRLVGDAPKDDAASTMLGAYVRTIGLYGQYTAEERAAFLDALATLDVTSYGVVEDRAGRVGVAFGTTHHVDDPRPFNPAQSGPAPVDQPPLDPDGHTDETRVILAPDTGELLAVENITSGIDYLPAATVTGYTLHLDDTYVATMPGEPTQTTGPPQTTAPAPTAEPMQTVEPLTAPEAAPYKALVEGTGFVPVRIDRNTVGGTPFIDAAFEDRTNGTLLTFALHFDDGAQLQRDAMKDPTYQPFAVPGGAGVIRATEWMVDMRVQSNDGTRMAYIGISESSPAGSVPAESVEFVRDVLAPKLLTR
ncbi:hypothetical protein [Georgenia ruanii]|uniref:hypothetical protein n=1 Tax=Georgenia ruanii TaxID=348442 RepID=UPI0012641477|nr:hypothetical protein [Georgenia ruanii]